MRVAMYYNNNDVRIEEMPVPEIGPGELLLRIEASSICGSDVMEWYRIQRAPVVLGHEVAGSVAAVGAGVSQFREGDRLVVTHHVPCNACRYCLNGSHTVCDTLRATNYDPGGFCEYVRLPAINVDRGAIPSRTACPSTRPRWPSRWPASTGARSAPTCSPASRCWYSVAASPGCFT